MAAVEIHNNLSFGLLDWRIYLFPESVSGQKAAASGQVFFYLWSWFLPLFAPSSFLFFQHRAECLLLSCSRDINLQQKNNYRSVILTAKHNLASYDWSKITKAIILICRYFRIYFFCDILMVRKGSRKINKATAIFPVKLFPSLKSVCPEGRSF